MEDLEAARTDKSFKGLPEQDRRRQMWLAIGNTSAQFLGSLPRTPQTMMTEEEFNSAFENYFGLPATTLERTWGLKVPDWWNKGEEIELDRFGDRLACTARGGPATRRHDNMKFCACAA